MINQKVFPLKSFLFFFHSGMAIIVSFLPVYLKSLGLTGKEVGWLMAIGPLAGIVSQPIWGFLSDKFKTVKRLLLIALVFMIFLSIILFQIRSFPYLVVMLYIFFFFMAPAIALGDSLAQRTANSLKISFGSIRMWGSVGFAITALVVGHIFSIIGVQKILAPFLVVLVVAFGLAFRLTDIKADYNPLRIVDALKITGNMRFVLFLFTILFISTTHRANDNFLGIFIIELGGQEALIGLAWFIGVAAEALVFATGFILLGRFHELTLVIVAGFIYTFRWFIYSLTQDPTTLLYLQVLHGFSFGILYMASFKFVSKVVPKELQSTGHLVFVSVFFGIAGILGSLLGGYVIEVFDGRALYRYLSYLAMLGSIGMLIYSKRYSA